VSDEPSAGTQRNGDEERDEARAPGRTPEELVLVERHEAIALVTLNRPEKMNALNETVRQRLMEVVDELARDDRVKVAVLRGAGEKAFVAGADIGELAKMDPISGVEISRQGQEIFRGIERFPKPVLAAVGGYALGGGFELALACHMRIASDNAQFGFPEVGLGIIPGYGGTVRLARLVGLGRAIELTLTGDRFGADRAHAMGLVSEVVPRDELLDAASGLLRKVTSQGPVAVEKALESVYHALDVSTREAMALESSLFGLLASTDDMREGMRAFLEKRKPEFEGR